MNLKVKIIIGYRDDQYYSIDAEEAHKAYYLFLNPEMRGIFNNGVAIVGKNIMGIEPDYNGTMGWNQSHRLDNDDHNELRQRGVIEKTRDILQEAKELSYECVKDKSLLQIPLSKIDKSLFLEAKPQLGSGELG